ncbi:hypothetical protein E3N88_26751 [Mikania micrantha]|uniref:Uncharacterized protein n=1 Tax=Mikania micrantha TaxID=192012 RepID=A0A5N6MVT2_9ASTR|nr:hypothetical protein E3N88_26751 [Mikania micrantha]
MSTHGRERRHPHRRFAAGGNGHEQRDPRDIAEIERLQQRIRDLELNQFHHEDDSATESVVWDHEDHEFHNMFGHRPHRDAPTPPPADPLHIQDNIDVGPDFSKRG